MEKAYNELNDIEHFVLREYKSWAGATCPVSYKTEMLTYWRGRAKLLSIEHLL